MPLQPRLRCRRNHGDRSATFLVTLSAHTFHHNRSDLIRREALIRRNHLRRKTGTQHLRFNCAGADGKGLDPICGTFLGRADRHHGQGGLGCRIAKEPWEGIKDCHARDVDDAPVLLAHPGWPCSRNGPPRTAGVGHHRASDVITPDGAQWMNLTHPGIVHQHVQAAKVLHVFINQ